MYFKISYMNRIGAFDNNKIAKKCPKIVSLTYFTHCFSNNCHPCKFECISTFCFSVLWFSCKTFDWNILNYCFFFLFVILLLKILFYFNQTMCVVYVLFYQIKYQNLKWFLVLNICCDNCCSAHTINTNLLILI